MPHTISWNSYRLGLCATSLLLTLSACGGGASSNVDNTVPATPLSLSPLQGGERFLGTASFGDTVSVTLAPDQHTVHLQFLDSAWGLPASVSSGYIDTADGSALAQAFTTPDGQALTGMRLRFTRTGGQLQASLDGVPHPRGTGHAPLQGHVLASNQGVAQASELAGRYSFLRQRSSDDRQGPAQPPELSSGEFEIDAQGKLRVCYGQSFSAQCLSGDQATTGQLSPEADQQRFPGALQLEINGMRIGRVMVDRSGASPLLLIDEVVQAGTSLHTGTWVARNSAETAAATTDGQWLCSQTQHDDQGAATGRNARHFVSIQQAVLRTDTLEHNILLRAQSSWDWGTDYKASASGLWSGTWDNGAPARVLLPLGQDLLLVQGQLRTPGQAGGAATRFAGQCQRLATPGASADYSQAKADGTATLVRLRDLHPTQPTVGFDQIYYKQGRYRHVATGNTASTQWQKAFDDLCEDSGLNESKGVTTASRLNDRSSFQCKAAVAGYPAMLKTAVVGPGGQLYLTDGHHSFTSLWEAPNSAGLAGNGLAGGDVQMPVLIKANYHRLDMASFWRVMRAQGLTWLKAADGSALTPAELPTLLGLDNGLQDDPYRSLVYFTREIGYDKPLNPSEFLEFHWSEWLRAAPRNLDLSGFDLGQAGNGQDRAYLDAVRQASQMMIDATFMDTIGGSYSPAQMGQLKAFGQSVFDELATAKPANGKKAGKLAYALEYRQSLPQSARPSQR